MLYLDCWSGFVIVCFYSDREASFDWTAIVGRVTSF